MSASQEQKQGAVVVAVVKPVGQEQTQGVPPDPVQEQKQSYTPPENAIANDPITEVTTVEEAMAETQAKEQPKTEEKKQ